MLALVFTILVMKGITKVSVKIGSIVVEEWAINMSTSAVSRISMTLSTVNLNVFDSWYIYGFC